MHWMSPGTCTYCNPVSQGPVVVKPGPKGQNSRRTKNQITPTREVRERYYVLVHSKLGREDPSFGDIQKQTEIVHVTGALYLWVVKKILQLGPKVRTIECTPKALLGNSDTIRKLCRGHGVEIVGGFNRADLSLGEEEIASSVIMRPEYRRRRRFILNLQGQQKDLLRELLATECEAAKMAVRYFCLAGEKFVSCADIAEAYWDKRALAHIVRRKITAVLLYLDPSFTVDKGAQKFVGAIRRQVSEHRRTFSGAVTM